MLNPTSMKPRIRFNLGEVMRDKRIALLGAAGMIISALVLSGCDQATTPTPSAPPAPTVTISVAPAAVATGQEAKLTWTSANASSCAASGGWIGSQSTSGTLTLKINVPGKIDYFLACSNSAGVSVTGRASLNIFALPLGLTIPTGFSLNGDLLNAGGPVAFNNFDNAYLHGGFLPDGGMQIIIAESAAPPPPLDNFIDVELHDAGATAVTRGAIMVGGQSCTKVEYEQDDGVSGTKNQVAYCQTGAILRKFILSFNKGDSKESQYLAAFGEVLGNVVFP